MRLDRALLLANLLLILVSVAAHQVAADEYSFLIVTVFVCLAVWRRTTSGRPIRMNETLANVTCLAAFIVLMYRAFGPTLPETLGLPEGFRMLDVGVTSVGDFLIVYQWVALLREKQADGYFWVYLVTLVHMGTAGLQMPGVGYGFFFIPYVFVAICALSLHHAVAEAAGAGAQEKEIRVGARFLLGNVPAAVLILILCATVFASLPRRAGGSPMTVRLLTLPTQPVAGFSPRVHLGEIGEIQDNPQPVMHVTVRDPATGQAVQTSHLLLRGLTLGTYSHRDQDWTWERTTGVPRARWVPYYTERGVDLSGIYRYSFPGYFTAPYHKLVCDITLELLDTPLLFVPFAPESITSERRLHLEANTYSYTLQESYNRRRAQVSYTVTSRLFDVEPPPDTARTRLPEPDLQCYLQLPPELSPQILALAQEIVPPSLSLTDYQKADRILAYLSDSRRFSYTTMMTPTPGVEPVEDFLFNLHHGHCEYFASAMALLLREVNVPARIVNGFKVTEWNPITSTYIVRQENAHSWVEAYLRPYGWRTLDASVLRDAATPRPFWARRVSRMLYDWTQTLWVTNVLSYDATEQAWIYGKMNVLSLFNWLGTTSSNAAAGNPGASPSPSTYPVAVLTAVAVALAVALAWMLFRGLPRTKRPGRSGPEVRFYRQMEGLLARRGFRRELGQTPREFRDALAARGWPTIGEVALVTERFCSARYGGRTPTAEQLQEIHEALAAIRRSRAGRSSPTAP